MAIPDLDCLTHTIFSKMNHHVSPPYYYPSLVYHPLSTPTFLSPLFPSPPLSFPPFPSPFLASPPLSSYSLPSPPLSSPPLPSLLLQVVEGLVTMLVCIYGYGSH